MEYRGTALSIVIVQVHAIYTAGTLQEASERGEYFNCCGIPIYTVSSLIGESQVKQ